MSALRYLPFARRALATAGPPIHLTLYVTGACNLRCRHCFHWKEVAASVPGPALADFERLAESCARRGPLLWVSFAGGEPFLRPDLADVAVAFGRRGLVHLAVPTNGLVPERQAAFVDRVLAECPDLHLTVSVSFDGPPAVHDAIRRVHGGHARATDAVRALRARAEGEPRLSVGILVCVTRENQAVLADHVEQLVLDLRPDNVTINLARGTALDPTLLDVDVDRYEEVVARKRALQRSGALPYFRFPLSRVAAARDDVMYDRVAAVARGGASWLPCTAGALSAVVFEGGDVHACEILGRSMGNLNDVGWDLGELWDGPAARELRRTIRDTRCACTWECAQGDNVLFRPRAWPRLALRALAPS